MTQQCRQTLHVCAMRFSRLDPADGIPIPGATNLFTVQAPIEVGIAFETEDGANLTVLDACGDVCVRERSDDKVVGVTLTPQLCVLDNELIGRLTGGTLVTSGAEVIGHHAPLLSGTRNKWSCELWTKRWNGSAQDGTRRYWQWGFPSASWRVDDFTLNNEHTPIPLVGVVSENVGFWDGPGEDWVPPLSAIYGVFATNILPTVQCGSLTLAAS
jgi:hypothetical protein